jgi:hypothetical protein
VRARTVLAFGVGFVLGSRAGRERYEQMVAAAQRARPRLDEYSRWLEQYSNRATR